MVDYRTGAAPAGLAAAADIDTVARALVRELLTLPDVHRVGIALVEGGGRRLRFLPASSAEPPAEWCHIDAYDDVPLTGVVRTGALVYGDLGSFEGRYAGLVSRQRDAGTQALAAIPLPGVTAPLGGLLLYYDRPQIFAESQCDLLVALASRGADAVRRVRARGVAASASAVAVPSDTSSRTASLALDDDPRAVGLARRFLRQTLTAWGLADDPIETAQLCLSELVTNAVIHADATSDLTVALGDGLLTVAVRDHGGAGPETAEVVEDEDPLRVFGRGLVLVEALSDSWGSVRDAVGTSSWFVLDLTDDARSAVS
ncbi:ATP-binding protein [Nocardioides sp. URHA0020]|uniref:ATP-binding protein n=1 Tax=Nocardioides sp. URHA0020 TaxID=1380392 RepID=UPI000AE77151|nr:ATP-binding protein [Nocardioides sp. URHA0020]